MFEFLHKFFHNLIAATVYIVCVVGLIIGFGFFTVIYLCADEVHIYRTDGTILVIDSPVPTMHIAGSPGEMRREK